LESARRKDKENQTAILLAVEGELDFGFGAAGTGSGFMGEQDRVGHDRLAV
jgi:hypothetical protein